MSSHAMYNFRKPKKVAKRRRRAIVYQPEENNDESEFSEPPPSDVMNINRKNGFSGFGGSSLVYAVE